MWDSTTFNTLLIMASAVVFGLFTLIRGRSDVWKSNYEAEKSRGDDLQREVISLKARVSELEAQPNIDKLFELMKVVAEQQKKTTDALDKISKRLK